MPYLPIQIWFVLLVVPSAVRWLLTRWRHQPRIALIRRAMRVVSVGGALLLLAIIRPLISAFAPVYPIAFTLLTGLPAVACAWRAGNGIVRAMRALVGATAVLTVGLIVWMVPFSQQYSFHSDCAPIERDSRTRLLVSQCQPDWQQRMHGVLGATADLNSATQGRTIFVAPDPRFVYTACGLEGSAERNHPLLRIERSTGTIDRSYATSAVFDGSCDPASARCIVLLPAERRLWIIDDRTGQVVFDRELPVGPRFVSVHGAIAIVGLAGPPTLLRVDLVSGDVEVPSDDDALRLAWFGRGGGLASIGGEEGSDETVFSVEFPSPTLQSLPRMLLRGNAGPGLGGWNGPGPLARVNLTLDRFQTAPLSLLDRAMSFELVMSVVPDRRRKMVYLVTPMEGAVLAHDLDTLAFRWRLPLAAGVRMADLDRSRGRLYVGNYASGWLYVVDVASRTIVDRIFVGRLVRQVRVDQGTGHVLTASRAAFLEIDPR